MAAGCAEFIHNFLPGFRKSRGNGAERLGYRIIAHNEAAALGIAVLAVIEPLLHLRHARRG